MILNAMTQDSVAGSLDRCMLGDLCVHPSVGPQEQILTVYSSKLKATGRQQFLYFWTLDKLNHAGCKRTWQGAISFRFKKKKKYPTHPPPLKTERQLNSRHYRLSFLFWRIYTTRTFQLHRGFPIACVPTMMGFPLLINGSHLPIPLIVIAPCIDLCILLLKVHVMTT